MLKAKSNDEQPLATEELDDAKAFDMRWFFKLNDAACSYNNGSDFFILVKDHHKDIQDSRLTRSQECEFA